MAAEGADRAYGDEEELLLMAEKEYLALLKRGAEQNTDAMNQLQEDAVLLAAWESSSPPLPEAPPGLVIKKGGRSAGWNSTCGASRRPRTSGGP